MDCWSKYKRQHSKASGRKYKTISSYPWKRKRFLKWDIKSTVCKEKYWEIGTILKLKT